MEKFSKEKVINITVIVLTIYLFIAGLGHLFNSFLYFSNMSIMGGLAFQSIFSFLALCGAPILITWSYFSKRNYSKLIAFIFNIIVAIMMMSGILYSFSVDFDSLYVGFAINFIIVVINTILLYVIDRKTIKDMLSAEDKVEQIKEETK